MTTVPAPQFTQNVAQNVLLEPYNAPAPIENYLDRFPASVYTRSVDSHFMRFMYTLLGPVGTGWLQTNYLAARLELETSGLGEATLDALYSGAFTFGRNPGETITVDTTGLLTSADWRGVRSANLSYQQRAIDFLNAARMGNTPLGMKLAATSGIGQNVDIYENYQSLFDNHSDLQLHLPHYGSTTGLGEFIVVSRVPVSNTVQQTLAFDDASLPLSTNAWTIAYNGYSTPPLASTATAATVQAALWALLSIGNGNVIVTGGPAPLSLVVTFTGNLSNQPIVPLTVRFVDVAGGTGATVTVPVQSVTGAIDPSTEVAAITPVDMYLMQQALDRLRPVASYPTYVAGVGALSSRAWNGILATTEYTQVVRFVTGTAAVSWPATDNVHWIQAGNELQAPQLEAGVQAHYTSFHNILVIRSYTDAALSDSNYATTTAVLPFYISLHIGPYPIEAPVMPFFAQFTDLAYQFTASLGLPFSPEPLAVTALTPSGIAVIDDIYPIDYLSLQGVPSINPQPGDLWSSSDRITGADILEIDLGNAQAVNYIALETTGKPFDIEIAYDALDQSPARRFVNVIPDPALPGDYSISWDPGAQNPWLDLTFLFNDGEQMIYTRYIRITFTRRAQTFEDGYLYDASTQTQAPYAINVRNLRVGRNVAPAVA